MGDPISRLDALVGVEDLGLRRQQGMLQGSHAESRLQRRRKLPSHHVSTDPVHLRHQVMKAIKHSDVDDICTPHLVRAPNSNTTDDQIRDICDVLFLSGSGEASDKSPPTLFGASSIGLALG